MIINKFVFKGDGSFGTGNYTDLLQILKKIEEDNPGEEIAEILLLVPSKKNFDGTDISDILNKIDPTFSKKLLKGAKIKIGRFSLELASGKLIPLTANIAIGWNISIKAIDNLESNTNSNYIKSLYVKPWTELEFNELRKRKYIEE